MTSINPSVLVRNLRGGKEKWIPGAIVPIIGPNTDLVRILENSYRYVHGHHLIADDSREQTPKVLERDYLPEGEPR